MQTGEQYFSDAEFINNIVTDLSATAQELSASTQSAARAINEISVSNNESAEGTHNIAEKTAIALQKSTEVTKIMIESKEISERLKNAVSKFQI